MYELSVQFGIFIPLFYFFACLSPEYQLIYIGLQMLYDGKSGIAVIPLSSYVRSFVPGGRMADVFDVSYYVLRKKGEMTAMKLQKLVYYAQAWSTVWDETPLVKEKFEAWAHGPVSPRLYGAHKGKFMVNVTMFKGLSDDRKLTRMQKETIDAVLDFYGEVTPDALSALSHHEPPWREARADIDKGERGDREITINAMRKYYSTL
jgi:uncharacterized phage-associated protein